MTSESHVNEYGWYLGAFVLGAATGVAIALLTAPRTGRETRERLKSAALRLEKTVRNIPAAIPRAVSDAVRTGQAAYERAREEAS